MTTPQPAPPPPISYRELAAIFLRLSLTAFGGPVAHIAMAEDELVTRRKWLTRDHYLDLVAATNLIPGPNSTEVMIHVGYVKRGIPGAILTGLCFITPAFLLTLALSVFYVSTGQIPQVTALLGGVKPVIVAIIAHVGWRLLLTALKNRVLWVLFISAVALLLLTDIPEVLVMVGTGIIYAGLAAGNHNSVAAFINISLMGHDLLYPKHLLWRINQSLLPLSNALERGLGGEVLIPTLWDIFFYFLKIGSVLFGSGYVLITYIQQDVVNRFGWLTSQQLLDAVAIGQTTPGPVLTTVTVVGYIIAGLPGAVAATIGVFLPSFVLVILTAPLIPRMRRSKWLGAFLSGVNAGVIAAILVTLLELANTALRTLNGSAWSPIAVLLALAALVLLIRFKLNATWLIVAGGVVGLLFMM